MARASWMREENQMDKRLHTVGDRDKLGPIRSDEINHRLL